MNSSAENKDMILKQPLGYRASRRAFLSGNICHAAANNIFIDPAGNVYPCCFNRKNSWGNIYTNSLNEIAESPVRLDLQKKLKRNDLGSGCNFCYNAIIAGNYMAAGSKAYDLSLFTNHNFPSSIEFELDTFCNLDCIMCPAELHSSKARNSSDTDLSEKLTPWLRNIKWAKFYGGEPFLVNIYYDIWERIIETNPNCIIKVQTNGTVLNEKIKELLGKGRFQISVSVDSLVADNYREIRQGADFDKMLTNLKYFIEYSKKVKIAADVAVCPMTVNAADIPGIIEFCNKNSAYINFNLVEFPKKFSLRYESSATLDSLVALYRNTKVPYLNFISWQIRKHRDSLVNQLELWKRDAIEREKIPVSEISGQQLAEIILGILDESKRAELKAKVGKAVSEAGGSYIIRKDIMEKLVNMRSAEMAEFLDKNTETEICERVKNIIKFGF